MAWRAALAQIGQKLNEVFSCKISLGERLSRLETLDVELMQWKDGLSVEFRPEQQTILDDSAHVDIYMLHLDYFNLLRVLHWGLITQRPEIAGKIHGVPRFRASEYICVGACLAMVRSMNMLVHQIHLDQRLLCLHICDLACRTKILDRDHSGKSKIYTHKFGPSVLVPI